MRALMVALAMASVGGAAGAGVGTGTMGPDIPQSITPTVPANARKQAEDALRRDLPAPDSVTFRAVKALEVASIRHGAFAASIDGPISIVCGQYGSQGQPGPYSWFFVALKRGQVLWIADDTSGAPDEAHDSCKGAGLAD